MYSIPATHGGLALFVFTERTFMELLVHHGALFPRRHSAIEFLETHPRLSSVLFFHHVIAFMAMIRRRTFPFHSFTDGEANSLLARQT
jgi:hypothetical protein